MKVTVNASNVLTLTCIPNGFAANWSIAPASWNYGDVAIGSTSSKGFTIQNTGNLADALPGFTLSPSLVGVVANFGATTCHPATVYAPAATCLLVLDFAPTAVGPVSGTLGINGFPSATSSITANGTPAPAQPAFDLQPQSHDWGIVAINTLATPFAFTLTNTGNGASGPYSIQLSGIDVTQFILMPGGCDGLNLAAGGSCPILVNFAPTSAGPKQSALIVFGPAAAGSNMTGTGQ